MATNLTLQAMALENAFFLQEDKKLIEKLQQMQKMQETKEALRAVSGIHNDHVLEKLVKLDIQPQTVAALAVIPLVETAWADGHVDQKERQAILSMVEGHGVKKGSIDHGLLEDWLGHKPSPKLLDAWVHYVEGLCQALTPEERNEFKETILHDVRAVAESSGGFLGLGKSSGPEKAMIQKLEKAFS